MSNWSFWKEQAENVNPSEVSFEAMKKFMEQMMNTELEPVTPGIVIKGVHYEFKKSGTVNCFIAYIKQEIVWEDWVEFVKGYAKWLEETKPEIFVKPSYHSAFKTLGDIESDTPTSTANPKTQKAKGIKYISSNKGGFRTIPFEILTGEDRDQDAADKFIARYAKVFARPCPETPRHGFVDSRVVEGKEEVFKLFNEVKEVDPNGELVIMQPIEATLNCVITPSSITIGAGHDGATAGKNTKTFPLFKLWKQKFSSIEKAGIAEGDVPYLETVTADDKYDNGKHYLTQMRGGPDITTRAVDYVPEQVVVREIIPAEGDLLAWESKMKVAAGRVGTVVDHSNGALTSHYGVHAILNKIPVLTSRAPVMGETLEKVDDTAKPDYMAVIAGIVESLQVRYREALAPKRVTAMIYATQYFSGISGKDAYYIGFAIGTMLNYGTAACGGEYRHNPNNPKKKHFSRNTIYDRSTRNFLKYRVALAKWARSFALDKWSGAYGGLKWYDCADAIIQLDTQTRKFMRNPSENSFKDMMMAMNRAINCAHNGGWWFNKFIHESVFNHINEEHLPTIVTAVSYLYDQKINTFGVEHLDFYNKYAGAKVINPKVTKSVRLNPVFAQARICPTDSTDPTTVTAENCGVTVRIQIEWENGQVDEQTIRVTNLAEGWDFDNKNFQTSRHSGLVAYLPVTWEECEENWVFKLASNGFEFYTVPVKFGFTKEQLSEQEEEE